MPGGTGRSRSLLYCSSFNIVIRKHHPSLCLLAFLWPVGSMRGRFTPAASCFQGHRKWDITHFIEVVTDSGFYCGECFSETFSHFCWCVISYFFLSGEMLFLGRPPPLFSFFVTMLHTPWRFCFFCRTFCKSLYHVCRWSGLSVASNQLWWWEMTGYCRSCCFNDILHERTSCSVRVRPPTRQKTEDQCHRDDSLLRVRAEFVRE